MSIPIIVKILALIFLVVGVWISIFLFRNPASPDSLRATGIIAASLLSAIIAIAPLFATKKTLQEKVSAVLFFDEKEKTLAQTFFDPYSRAYFELTANLEPDQLLSREIRDEEVENPQSKEYWLFYQNEKGLDLLERLVLSKIASKFHNHWDIAPKTYLVPTGSITEQNPNNKNEDVIDVQVHRLINEKYGHNDVMNNNPLSIVPPDFSIPKKCNIHVITEDFIKEGDKRIRKLIFEVTDQAKVTISILPTMAGPAEFGVWGLFPKNKNLKSLSYSIEIQLEYRQYSIENEAYLNWYKNIVSTLKELDWESIDEEIEKGLMRQLLSQQ